MKGVILAGGRGTRLWPLTRIVNKHLIGVYNKPMIYYPIATLKQMGITDILLVSGGENIGGFVNLLGDGTELGVNLTYRVQTEAGGIAQALKCAQGFVDGLFCVILGDNYFSDAPDRPMCPSLYLSKVNNPQDFGVFNPHDGHIVEKPVNPPSDMIVTGLYVYDLQVFDILRTLKPSARGELEITDVNNWYLDLPQTAVVNYRGTWFDLGTHDSLLVAANFIKNKG